MFSTYEVIACRGGFVLTLGLNTQIWMHSCWSHTSWRDCCKSCVFDTSEAIKQDGMHAHIRAKRMKLTARYSQLTTHNSHLCRCRENAKQGINECRFVCRGVFVLFSSHSWPVVRQTCAVVSAQTSCIPCVLALKFYSHCHAFVYLSRWLEPWPACTHPSLLAAVQSAAQKCRRRMPQTVAKRQMSERPTRIDRGVGRITCHRHEPHVCSCKILR